jgi:hypothetical protein
MSHQRFIALVLAAGCGTSIRSTPINQPPHPMMARDPASVELFTSGAPPRPHVDVTFIEAEESSSLSTHETPDMLRELRDKGAQLGCDGVVIGGVSSRDPGVNDAEAWLVDHPKGRKGIFATCIVYTAPPLASQ